ncbi:hypothetical protein, partial [Bartonella sp. AC134YNZD]|uniref:hypothetical protein n=1 Tax=Bartonella sp. AC134YNZD TaxID=3243446 RepID=UPI0035CFE6DD
ENGSTPRNEIEEFALKRKGVTKNEQGIWGFHGKATEAEGAGPSEAGPPTAPSAPDEAGPSSRPGPSSSQPASTYPKRKRGTTVPDNLSRIIKFCKGFSKDLAALHQKVAYTD